MKTALYVAILLCVTLCISPAFSAEISGEILVKESSPTKLWAGFVAQNQEGRPFNCGCGTTTNSEGMDKVSVSCLSFEPYEAVLSWDKKAGATYRHKSLTPGRYLVYARSGEHYLNWKVVEVKSTSSRIALDFTMDTKTAGAVRVQLPNKSLSYNLRFSPLDSNGKSPLPEIEDLDFWLNTGSDASGGTATVQGLRPGKYQLLVQIAHRQGNEKDGYFTMYEEVGAWTVEIKSKACTPFRVPSGG